MNTLGYSNKFRVGGRADIERKCLAAFPPLFAWKEYRNVATFPT